MSDEYAPVQRANQTYGLGQVGGQAPRPRRRLDDIGAAADATARISERLDGVIARFQSASDQFGGADGANAIAVSYTSHLDRLQANIDRIVKALDQLEELA